MNEELSHLFGKVKIELPETSVEETDDRHGTLTVSPLLRGYGTTLGNSLRRVLLSSLPGTAVVKLAMSVNGNRVLHEMSSLPGVKEDMTEIVLNVKGIIGKSYSDNPVTVYIDTDGDCEITAADIRYNPELIIVNPEKHIATVSGDTSVHIELTFASGVGFVPSERNKAVYDDGSVGLIFTDSVFTPIRNVNYTVENTRVGDRMEYDKLTLEVETNGSLTPKEAIVVSSQLLKEHYGVLSAVCGYVDNTNMLVEGEDSSRQAVLDASIDMLDLSNRSYHCLKRGNIDNISDLAEMTVSDMMKIRNLGKKSFDEIESKLKSFGLSFKSEEE